MGVLLRTYQALKPPSVPPVPSDHWKRLLPPSSDRPIQASYSPMPRFDADSTPVALWKWTASGMLARSPSSARQRTRASAQVVRATTATYLKTANGQPCRGQVREKEKKKREKEATVNALRGTHPWSHGRVHGHTPPSHHDVFVFCWWWRRCVCVCVCVCV